MAVPGEASGMSALEQSVSNPLKEEASDSGPSDRPRYVLDFFFPQTWGRVVLLVVVFVFGIMIASIPWGLAYDRFDIRARLCYEDNYQKKTGEDLDHPWCIVFSYPYRLVDPSTISRLFPWLLYMGHQLGQWIIIWQAQQAKQRGEVGWGPEFDTSADTAETKPAPPPDYRPNLYARRMFALNMGMVLFKFVQSHITYDGLANDVPEISALGSVAVWLFLAMAIQMPKRGIIFGYWRSFGEGRFEFGNDMIAFIRKYHGYAFSFGVTYNFWYHPIEGSPGFILGYLHQFVMILQTGFLFHPFHRNKFWTLILEMGVIPHSLFIALFLANGQTSGVFMFPFGFLQLFLTTYMHGFDLSFLQKVGYTVAYFALAIGSYLAVGRPLSNISEIFFIGTSWSFVPMGWLIWVLGCAILTPLKGLNERQPWTTGALWFAIWVAVIVVCLHFGAMGGRGDGGIEVPPA